MPNPLYHIAVSSLISATSYVITQSPQIAIITFAVGTSIDGDHLLDVLISKDKESIKDVVKPSFYERQNKIYVPLHSYELAVIFLILTALLNQHDFGIWVTLSFIAHVGLDQVFYRPHPLFYFGLFRVYKRFSSSIQGKSYSLKELWRYYTRLFKFGLIGGIGTLIGLGIIYVLVNFVGLHYIVSYIIAFCTTTTTNYLCHSMFAFKDRVSSFNGYLKYFFLHVSTLLITTVLLYLFTTIAGIHYMISTVIVTGCGFLLNYLISKTIVWRVLKYE